MSTFKIRVSFRDSKTNDPVYFKQDGKRFGETSFQERTLKFSTSVKYQVKITVPTSVAPLKKLVIEHADLAPDKSNEGDRDIVYYFSWITNGFPKTKKGGRVAIPVTLVFDTFDVAFKIQAKFYEFGNTQHLTWGQAVNSIELICKQEETQSEAGNSAMSPLQVNFI